MPYKKSNNKNVLKYVRNHYHRFTVDIQKEFYDEVLKPYCESNGITVASFAKEAIINELARRKGEMPEA